MDQATLVAPDLAAARDAISLLAAADIKQIIALFALFPEYGDWRLVLSSPSLDQAHLLKAHDRVAHLLQGRFVYTLPLMMILPTRDPFIRSIRKTLSGVRARGYIRLGNQSFGNRFVTDALIVSLPGVITGIE